MRLAFGFIILMFGIEKLKGGTHQFEELGQAMGMFGIHFAPVFWGMMSALTESVGGLLIIAGFFFRPAATLLVLNMVVACATQWHGGPIGGDLPMGKWLQMIALPGVFCLSFFAMMLTGPGRFALGKSP